MSARRSNTLWPRDLHDFAPRLGFAYQPKAGGKLVIRGGWGMFYQVPNMAYFGDSGASNGAGTGINGNIGGPAPVLTVSNQNADHNRSGRSYFCRKFRDGPFGGFSVSQHFVTGYSLNYQPEHSVSSGQRCGGRSWLFGQLEPPLAGHAGYQPDPASARRNNSPHGPTTASSQPRRHQ